MTPGVRSTEFWITLALVVLNSLVTSSVLPTAHWAVQLASAIIAGAAALGYTASRTMVKRGSAPSE